MDRWFRNVNVVRAVALFVGIMLWVIVRLDVQHSEPTLPNHVSQKYTDVSIKIVGLDNERYTLRSVNPDKVSLSVVGTSAALRRVNIRDYEVVLDLTEASPGEQLIPLMARGFPSNVDVIMDPPNVSVTLDEKERKEVPVTVKITGTPAAGFTAGEPVVQPNRVNVTVPSSLADEVASVVGVVHIGGAKTSITGPVKLVALNRRGEELDVVITPAVVDVEVPITSPFKTVPLQISLKGSTPQGFAVGTFEQSATEVTVYATQSVLDRLQFYKGPSIDLSQLLASNEFELDIPLMNGIEKVEPAKVTVEVKIVEAREVTFPEVPLEFNGRNEEYNYRILSPSPVVSVRVEAAPDVIAGLSSKDIRAVVDVSNLPPGAHEVEIDYSLPSFVETVPGNVRKVTVEIEAKKAEEPETPTTSEPETSKPPSQPAVPEEPEGQPGQPPEFQEPAEPIESNQAAEM